MPTQLQLEGAELEPLLDRVRSELGPGARIVQAEKVRTGGVAGFFARQRFELTVELPDGAEKPATAPAAEAPAAPAAVPAQPKPTAPASLLDLADQVSQDEQAANVSTESPTFASLLSRLGSAMGGAPAPAPAPAAPAPATAVKDPAAAPAGAPAAGAATSRSSADVIARAVAERAPAAPGTPLTTQPRTPQPSRLPEPAAVVPPQRRSAETAGVVALRPSPAVLDQPSALAPGSASRLPTWPSSGDAGAGTATSVELARLGLPAHLRPAIGGDGLYPALVDALKQLPKVPRTSNRAGGLLAVVGPLPLALEVAREIAQEMGLPVATAVVVATPSRTATGVNEKNVVRSTTVAAERRALWRRRRNLTIVAVDAPLTSAGAAQGRDFLTALEPTSTWGAVEATRKAHDVGTWTRALGGVHALALTGVEETADPAAVLELGIPVGRVGHRPASPAVWASLLTGRLAA